jgi:8-oxo-dGTP diphosphatase
MPACDDCGQWPQPALAVDAVVINDGEILLITRGREPWKGMLALPGGFVNKGEDPEIAVLRELKEETGLDGEVDRLLCVRGDPKRDPRGHVVSIAYLVKATGNPQGGDDAVEANWYDLNSITKLAGDHVSMVNIVGNK